MGNHKYKLVKTGLLSCFSDKLHWNDEKFPLYRIQALRDIPEHNVNKGDLGGYVTSILNLSQVGSCWIGGTAKVVGNVFVSEDAYVGGSSVVICPEEDATIDISGAVSINFSPRIEIDNKSKGNRPVKHSVITGDIKIYGYACITNVEFIDATGYIRNSARIDGAKQITGEVYISGKSQVSPNVTIAGKTYISDNSIVEDGATVVDCTLLNKAVVHENETVKNQSRGGYPGFMIKAGESVKKQLIAETSKHARSYNANLLFDLESRLKFSDEMLKTSLSNDVLYSFINEFAMKNGSKVRLPLANGQKAVEGTYGEPVKEFTEKPSLPLTASQAEIEASDALNLLAEIKAELHAYESDIVKILQYPAMTDKTDPFTLELTVALKLANRLSLNPYHKGFVASVFDLEKKFIAAEANALKIASTHLSEIERKKAEKAKDLFAVAADEASSENEKHMAFVQGFKQLESVIVVPEVAVENFRVKIGLKEIEMSS